MQLKKATQSTLHYPKREQLNPLFLAMLLSLSTYATPPPIEGNQSQSMIEPVDVVAGVPVLETPPPPLSPWATFPPKPTSDYRAYSLRDDIAYVELRKYLIDQKTNQEAQPFYDNFFSIYRKPLSSFPKEIIDRFEAISFKPTQPTEMTLPAPNHPHHLYKIKGFVIKKDNSFWTFNEKRDLVWLFEKIDTPAEVYQFLRIQTLGRDVAFIEYTQNQEGIYTIKAKEGNQAYYYHLYPDGKWNRMLIESPSRDKD